MGRAEPEMDASRQTDKEGAFLTDFRAYLSFHPSQPQSPLYLLSNTSLVHRFCTYLLFLDSYRLLNMHEWAGAEKANKLTLIFTFLNPFLKYRSEKRADGEVRTYVFQRNEQKFR